MNLTTEEKIFVQLTKDNISYFNAIYNGNLAVEYYVDSGNVARITENGITVMDLLTIRDAFYAIAGIVRYHQAKEA